MSNEIWLFLALPGWYFSTIKDPFGAGLLSAIPFVGILSLVAGTIIGIFQRRRQLLLFIVSALLSEIYVAIAGMLRGQMRGRASLAPFCIFLALQACVSGLLIHRLKGARLAAAILSVFCISYALFAAFVGGMAFADDWL